MGKELSKEEQAKINAELAGVEAFIEPIIKKMGEIKCKGVVTAKLTAELVSDALKPEAPAPAELAAA